jgi:hypothetical protein
VTFSFERLHHVQLAIPGGGLEVHLGVESDFALVRP